MSAKTYSIGPPVKFAGPWNDDLVFGYIVVGNLKIEFRLADTVEQTAENIQAAIEDSQHSVEDYSPI